MPLWQLQSSVTNCQSFYKKIFINELNNETHTVCIIIRKTVCDFFAREVI
jgi:hypothetical protein